LNTSYALISISSTQEDRAAVVLQGFHGLQLYANQFWQDHLLAYCEHRREDKTVSDELLNQLNKLLIFQKDPDNFEQHLDDSSIVALKVFDGHLPVKALVLAVLKFRAVVKEIDVSKLLEKSITGK
jgi:hypothetical protein